MNPHHFPRPSGRDGAKELSCFALCLVSLCAACASPPPAVLEVRAARDAIEDRSAVEVMEARLSDVVEALLPSALTLPAETERSSPAQAGYWQVRAFAFAPGVRSARRAYRASAARARSAGAPAPVAIQAVDHELGGEDKLVEAIGVLDLVGLLGLGPSRAERGLALARERLALGELESAAFRASLASEGARIRTVAARARLEALEGLWEDASRDLERVRILQSHDRISDASAALARAEVARVDRRASLEREALEAARLSLATAVGVRAQGALSGEDLGGSSDLYQVGQGGLEELFRPGPESFRSQGWFDAAAAIEAHPDLRRARLAFEVAESEVREAASRAWPGIGLGPHLGYLDEARIGAVLRLALPFPASWRGVLEAAIERRDRAIEAYEETLLDLMNREREALLRGRELVARGLGSTPRSAGPAVEHWRAARALFKSSRGSVGEWTKALNHLMDTMTWGIDDAEAAALAALDLIAARGPLAMDEIFGGASRQGVEP